MKNTLIVLTLLLSSLSFASLFDDEVDAKEIANAITKCPTQFAGLVQNYEYIHNIEGLYQKINSRVSSKTYTLKSQSGGGFQPTRKGATLVIKAVVTQPDPRAQDMPSKLDWSCKLTRSSTQE